MVPARRPAYNRAMDRDRLQRWLTSPHRTWRWRFDDDYDRYEGVQTSDDGLRWFLWSHVPGEDGAHEERTQSFASFAEDGPLRPLPEDVARELAAWLEENAA